MDIKPNSKNNTKYCTKPFSNEVQKLIAIKSCYWNCVVAHTRSHIFDKSLRHYLYSKKNSTDVAQILPLHISKITSSYFKYYLFIFQILPLHISNLPLHILNITSSYFKYYRFIFQIYLFIFQEIFTSSYFKKYLPLHISNLPLHISNLPLHISRNIYLFIFHIYLFIFQIYLKFTSSYFKFTSSYFKFTSSYLKFTSSYLKILIVSWNYNVIM